MSSLFYQHCAAQGPVHISSHPSLHMYQTERSFSRPSSPPDTSPMESYSTAEEAALYQMSTVRVDADPRLSISSHANSFVLPMHPASRRSNASVEHWLTTESPVARATNFESHQHPQNPYRLPSLPGTAFLPEHLDCTADTKYDMSAIEGFAMPDVPYGQPAHLQMPEVDTIQQHVSPPATWNIQDEYYSTSTTTLEVFVTASPAVPGTCPFDPNFFERQSKFYKTATDPDATYDPPVFLTTSAASCGSTACCAYVPMATRTITWETVPHSSVVVGKLFELP